MAYIRRHIFTLSALLLMLFVSVVSMRGQKERWQELRVIAWDVQEYYMYLPAYFIYNDLDFNFTASLPDSLKQKYWLHDSPTGKKTGRLSVGMAIMYTPFFLAAHTFAKILDYPANGFSIPYQFFIFISGFVYAMLGLLLLRKVLLRYFTESISALTLICIFLATNLFYYSTTEGAMTHAALFFLFSAYLYLVINWHEKPKLYLMLLLAAVAGLAILIRPSSILIAIIFLLYKQSGKNAFAQKLQLYKKYYPHFLAVLPVLFIVALPQLLYWKNQTGLWIYYSYTNEGFFFSDPKIWQGLFSYRKGWLLYTPVMLLSLAGFIPLYKRVPQLFFAILIYSILHIYVIFSWWCWWYGGSFGMRAMIETYVFLAIPMGALYTWLWQKQKVLFFIVCFFALGCLYLNRLQTSQYRDTVIHWDSMSKAYYWKVFAKREYPSPETIKLLAPPDYDAAMKGER